MPGNTLTIYRIKVPRRPFEIMGLTFVLLTITFLLSFISPAFSTVQVQSWQGSTLRVTMDETTTISGSSIELNLSGRIERPEDWSDFDLIAAEVAITNSSSDSAAVFRGTGSCQVDISSSYTTPTFGTIQGPGSVTITGAFGNANIFVLNDRTPQLSLQGQIIDVVTALQRVQISCDSQLDLAGLYVRVGTVPTVSSTTCNGNSDTTCGDLYYVFSTQRYYRSASSTVNDYETCTTTYDDPATDEVETDDPYTPEIEYEATTCTQNITSDTSAISNLFSRAQEMTIPVDGTVRSGAVKYGWVATLSQRDEIILTNALVGERMIGTTDMFADWNWDSNWGGSGSNCSTDEGDFKWLGPDEWCNLVPTWNQFNSISYGTTSRYWKLENNVWSHSTASDFTIDFGSTTIPTSVDDVANSNGYNVYHSWHTDSSPDEPNSSGDYIYMGYSGSGGNPGWDDAEPGGAGNRAASGTASPSNFYAEFCSPADPCAPPDTAVASTQLKIAQTITFTGAASSYSTETVNLTAATTTSGLSISYSSSDAAICTVDSSSGVVTLVSRGTCAITASQAGNTDYLAATDVTQTFTSNFGTEAGPVTSCEGFGALGNGGFETLPTVTENSDSSFTGVGRWHGYRSGNANDPRYVLFLNPAGSATFALDSWRVTGNTRIEIQRFVTNWGLTASDQSPDTSVVSPAAGTFFAELNADFLGTLYQDIATVPGTTLRWSLDHRGRRTGNQVDTMNLKIGPTGGTLVAQTPTTRPANSGSGISMQDGRGSTATQTGGGSAGGWGTYRGVYTVPAGQTTTRFSFESTDAGSGGNLLDNIVFTPTIACPDTTAIISDRAAVNFSAVTNDYFPADSTVSVVSITGNGSATVSGTNLSLSSSTVGSYTVRYRITNPDGDTSDSTVTVTVLSESTPRLPDVLLVDPRTNTVDFPQANFENTTNLLVCVQESDSDGSILGSPTVSFDVAAKGTSESTGEGSTTISGDRTSTLLLRHTRENVLTTFNSSGGLRAYLSSGNFTSTKYVRVRTVPVATSTTAVTSATCGDAAASASKTIEIRPLGLTNTLRKGTIQLK